MPCNSSEHLFSRRGFLAGAAGLAGLSALAAPTAGKALAADGKRVLVVWLSGGVSQLATWDPKPGTNTGGPFQAIDTSAPGIQVCELLPLTAKHMHRMALVRGLN